MGGSLGRERQFEGIIRPILRRNYVRVMAKILPYLRPRHPDGSTESSRLQLSGNAGVVAVSRSARSSSGRTQFRNTIVSRLPPTIWRP
jgi:hypothetical protein